MPVEGEYHRFVHKASVGLHFILFTVMDSKGNSIECSYNRDKGQWSCCCKGFYYLGERCPHIKVAKDYLNVEGALAEASEA